MGCIVVMYKWCGSNTLFPLIVILLLFIVTTGAFIFNEKNDHIHMLIFSHLH